MIIQKVLATQQAKDLINKLRKQNGELIFHQSGGCCDGSAPMCYPKGDFRIGESDRLLGTIHGCLYYMSAFQYEYWKNTQITLDVVEGRGSSFSLEIPLGVRFIINSRLFSTEEITALETLNNSR